MTCFCLADYEHGVSKVQYKWPKEKSTLLAYFNKKVTKTSKNTLKTYRPKLYWIKLTFQKIKFFFCHIKSFFNLKSSLLTLYFSVRLSVQYTLKSLYLIQKQKNMLQKRIDPNCIIINFSFHNFENGFGQIKSDFNFKSSFLALDFGHKGQCGVLAQTCSFLNTLPIKTA